MRPLFIAPLMVLLLAACVASAPRPVPADFAIGGTCDEWCQAQYALALDQWEQKNAADRQDAEDLAIALIARLRGKTGKLSDEDRALAIAMCRIAGRRVDTPLDKLDVDWCGELLAPPPSAAPEVAPPPVENPA